MRLGLSWWRSRKTRRSDNKPLRIGIFEGAFNPPHYGHLLCALFAQQELNLDFVYFVPLTNPPHKRDALDANSRFDMVVASVAENPYFRASRVAIEHGGTGYSLMTVEAIHRQHPNAELFYLTSSEYLDPAHKYFLGKWIGGKELFGLCRFVVFPRGNHKKEQIKQWASLVPRAKIDVVDLYSPPVSSTDIRRLVAEGKSIRYLTPFDIQTIISREHHYWTSATPQPTLPALPTATSKRIALFGGQFNPITYGDLWMADTHT
jgi:nicotinate-nucleotide adenylyltransferase